MKAPIPKEKYLFFSKKAFFCILTAFAVMLSCVFTGFPVKADETPSFELIVTEDEARLYAKSFIGLTNGDLSFSYNSDVIESVSVISGEDANQVSPLNFNNNLFFWEHNANFDGLILYSFFFKDQLWEKEKFDEADITDETDINSGYFHLLTIEFTLYDEKTAAITDFSFSGRAYINSIPVSSFGCEVIYDLPAPEETTVPEESTTAPEESTTDSEESTTAPEESTTAPEESTTAPEESTTDSEESTTDSEESTVHEHSYIRKTLKEATSFEEGTDELICTSCGEKEIIVTPMLPVIAVRPEAENSVKLTESGDIFVLCGSSIRELLENIPENTELLDKDGNTVKTDSPVSTGMTVILKDSEGNILDEKVISVPGDVDCDGKISATDARSALRHAVGLEIMEAYQISAADLEADSSVRATDARTILRASVGLEDINKLFGKLK